MITFASADLACELSQIEWKTKGRSLLFAGEYCLASELLLWEGTPRLGML